MLYGVEVPSYGGDTMFANMQRAYEALSPEMKRTVEGMTGIFTNARTYGPQAQRFKVGVKNMVVLQQEEETRVEHPIVRTHPETGRKSLYVRELHMVGIRPEEHTSELQSLMRISYAVFCLKTKRQTT